MSMSITNTSYYYGTSSNVVSIGVSFSATYNTTTQKMDITVGLYNTNPKGAKPALQETYSLAMGEKQQITVGTFPNFVCTGTLDCTYYCPITFDGFYMHNNASSYIIKGAVLAYDMQSLPVVNGPKSFETTFEGRTNAPEISQMTVTGTANGENITVLINLDKQKHSYVLGPSNPTAPVNYNTGTFSMLGTLSLDKNAVLFNGEAIYNNVALFGFGNSVIGCIPVGP